MHARRAIVMSLALGAVIATPAAHAAEIGGIQFEDQIRANDSSLLLNGGGVRTKLVFKVYAMGLYLPQKADTPAAIYQGLGPRRIELVTLRELTAEQLSDALVDGLHKNLTKAEYEKLAPRIESLKSTMLSIGKAPTKTRISLDFTGSATRVTVNNVQKGADIAGKDFFDALLHIWLGDTPAQDDLKERLLGR
ncbi:chalcone isomerase family protein [Uliginosibacterium sp. sgz301328]|uniref:chalcone isomerase family protein n=1 Tax=Uliginosibacterium sp. sgz301328 TaxID=3243764 RepID=UPI00359EC15C